MPPPPPPPNFPNFKISSEAGKAAMKTVNSRKIYRLNLVSFKVKCFPPDTNIYVSI